MVRAKAAKKTSSNRRFIRRRVCSFCVETNLPDYKDISRLRRFVTERGKIMPRAKTGVCAAHQRRLAQEVKKARQIALLSYWAGA
jgi:small subunit ribosomal protein S18